ncbi:outer membrane beta-barrel domain-containing protein [Agaribacterium haliotis]|uniref:outer membrane beta-barrel domain-containing protein n=1 Tax=Agaribacterium haliotis TaxID=2013869 RepID=UPI000BB5393A|nr:outer membrane beta-barrel domain-containing protein [Agaribacterium haliotis]
MESWVQRIFLSAALVIALPGFAEERDAGDDEEILEGVINPDLERRQIDEGKIDSENFEFGLSAGVMSIEDFGTHNSVALHMAYHISEDWFLEGTYGASQAGLTSYEYLAAQDLLTEEERDLSYFDMSLGLNLLPGEIFLGEKHAFNAAMYVLAGVGSTQFGGDEYFTANYGAGVRFFTTDWLALRMGFNNRIFTHSIFGVDKTVQNLEANIGLSLFF